MGVKKASTDVVCLAVELMGFFQWSNCQRMTMTRIFCWIRWNLGSYLGLIPASRWHENSFETKSLQLFERYEVIVEPPRLHIYPLKCFNRNNSMPLITQLFPELIPWSTTQPLTIWSIGQGDQHTVTTPTLQVEGSTLLKPCFRLSFPRDLQFKQARQCIK